MRTIVLAVVALVALGIGSYFLIFRKPPATPAAWLSTKAVEQKVHSANPFDQSEGIASLELQKGQDSVRQLEGLLNSASPEEIMEAVRALGRLEAKHPIDKLEKLYKASMTREDGHGLSIRTAIIDALGSIQDERTVDFLGRELSAHESLMHKEHLLDALEKIGSKRALPYLEKYLKSLSEHPAENFPELQFLMEQAQLKTKQIIDDLRKSKS